MGDTGFLISISMTIQHKHEIYNIFLYLNYPSFPSSGVFSSPNWKIPPIWPPSLNSLSKRPSPTPNRRPSPHSALLHSSARCVTGIFPLTHFHVLIENSKLTQTRTLCFGAITTLLTPMRACMHTQQFVSCLTLCDPMDCSPPGWALTQNNIQKLVAFSTWAN